MHDIQILLKRSCFLVEPSKTATFSDLVKVVGKRIKNENISLEFYMRMEN